MKKNHVPLISITSNSLLIILKIVAGILMGSVAVISEAIHSSIDLLASVVTFFSIRKASEPADLEHPFGHGKFENLSGAFEAILIFVAAALIIHDALDKLKAPAMVEKLDWGIGIMFIATLINIFVSRVLFRFAKSTGSIAIEADAMHLWVEVFTSAGVMAGLILMRVIHLAVLDPIIALLVALLSLKAAFDLTMKAIADLADHTLPENEIAIVLNVLKNIPDIKGYHKLRTRKSGSNREIDIHIQVDKEMLVQNVHDLCYQVENAIKEELPGSYVTIHIEPTDDKTPFIIKVANHKFELKTGL